MHGFRTSVLFYIGLSLSLHLGLIIAVKPHVAQPFRSVGLAAKLAIAEPGGSGQMLVTLTPQNRKALASASQSKESLPMRKARRAVLIPQLEFGRQADWGSPSLRPEGESEWALASLNIPQVPDRFFSAAEVDIRAEPLGNLIPPGIDQSEAGMTPGRLRLRLLIDEFGVVAGVEVVESFPPGFLEKAMVRHVRNMLFNPARLNGIAVKSEKIIEITTSTDVAP